MGATMRQLESLHHLSFTVPDLEASLGFWCDLPGFEPIERPDLGFPGAWLSGHGVEALLLASPSAVAAERRLSPLRNHVAFRVESLDAARRRLEAAGLEVLGGRGAIRQIFVLDPGANVIDFIEPT
jgi:glyoxylase I family protein